MHELIAVFQSKEEISYSVFIGCGLGVFIVLYGVVFPLLRALLYAIGYTVFSYRVYEDRYDKMKLIISSIVLWPIAGFIEGIFQPRRVWVTEQLSWYPPLNYGPGKGRDSTS